MREISQEKINRKISKKKDSRKLRHADRINVSAFEGLTLDQVEERKKDNLINKKPHTKTKSVTKIFLENIFNFCNSLIIILCIALIAMGYWDYTISSAIIILNIAIGIYQEIKAKKTVQKLSLVNTSTCDVIRGGNTYNISTEELVLDDVFILSAGQQIPVDGEILDGSIEADESVLTGESNGVKRVQGEKVLAGSAVLAGEAAVKAERVGKDCYIESIAAIAKRISKPESRLFNSIDKIIKVFSVILVVLAILLFVGYRVANIEMKETLLKVISSMLGMIPCGMFLITSTALAQSVLKLAKRQALPQDIYSVEMLAMVDTLLLDKTGTITDGKLEVSDIYVIDKSQEDIIKDIILTMNDSTKDKKPTALALNTYCDSGKLLDCNDALPFSSKRKYSAITLDNGITYLLGAPDIICSGNSDVSEYCETNSKLGRRTILLASFEGEIDDIDLEKTKPVCVFSLEEELKEDVKETLAWFHNNDVNIKIISGDNPQTVSAIAQKAGVYNADKYVNCFGLTDDELRLRCLDTTVFGRVSPEQKVLIVKELKAQKHIVGMTGDGVNDVQALKASNCSISFGNANPVARNISRIVLLDNNFKSMPYIVEEGRRVINNIEKVSSLFIMKNLFIMAMTFIFAIVTLVTKIDSYPFTTKHILSFEFFIAGIIPFVYALLSNQERPKGTFMRNVVKVSIPSALSIIIAACIMLTLNSIGLSQVSAIDNPNYSASLAALAMTFTGFGCVVFISLPFNKIRMLTIFVSLSLAIAGCYIDYYLLNGLFLNVQLPTNIIDSLYVVGAVIVSLGFNLLFRYIFKKLDEKYGDTLIDKFIGFKDDFKESIHIIPNYIKEHKKNNV